ncbi:hypothetical protein MS3_00000856 [Schistosoma haematobium]|uniref:Uncharacterized protein n=1 Tax=Schistosoma haematobium TaxID=6185 RepID=A0A922LXA0_SCHHA|nr:hypothetical protein MS3_00000856 [Schistosoma haematobium]KAH9595701.1 hypothetical protein MS3_00000856 [Schistosoma haematobium]
MNHINITGKFMVSFDVTSLFKKIPLLETIDIICQHSDILPLPVPKLKRLSHICTKDVQFQFNDIIQTNQRCSDRKSVRSCPSRYFHG